MSSDYETYEPSYEPSYEPKRNNFADEVARSSAQSFNEIRSMLRADKTTSSDPYQMMPQTYPATSVSPRKPTQLDIHLAL